MRKPRFTTRIATLIFLFPLVGFSALAQSNKGSIVGTVTDPNSALVSGAKATATNSATGEVREATTGDEGTFVMSNLEPGKYRVTVEASGFQTVTYETVTVETNARVPLEVKFATITGGGGTVTITDEGSPLVESETSVRGDLITGKQVTDLPIPQRNFTLLATLSPGVTRPAVGVLGGGGNFESGSPNLGTSTESTRFRESGGSVLVVNGARPTNNNFTLDGVDNNEGQFAQIAIYPPPDTIAEFKIETSVPAAESGRAGGAVIATTTKSGTNKIHGTAYENYQGRFASAIGSRENPNALPNRVTHQFGGTVGGPVFLPRPGEGTPPWYDGRNRTFWFFYYEGQRNSTPSTTGDFGFVSVPTARMRVGDFSELLQPGTTKSYTLANGSTVVAPIGTVFCANGSPAGGNDVRNCGQPLSPAALNTLQAYPVPNVTSRIFDNYQTSRKERYNRDGYGFRIDHTISHSDSIFFAASKDKSVRVRDNNWPKGSSPNGNDLPSGFGAGEEFGNSRGVRLGETHTFSPTIINDARFGVTRVEIGINNPGINGALGFDPNVSANLGMRNINICGQCEGVVLLGIEEPNQRGRQNQLEFIGDGGPFYFLSNNWSLADTVTVIRGNHSLRFGTDWRWRQNSNFDGGRNGGIKGNVQYGTGVGGFLSGNFSGIGIGPDDSGSGIANFLLGYDPAFITRGTPGGPYFQSNREIAFFAQDDWKVNSNLTMNIGLRYDIFTQPTERFDRQTNYNPVNDTLTRAGESAPGGRDLVNSDKNNFGPRIGFAWSGFRDDRTVVIRGGYGLLYAVDIPGIPGILSTNPPGGANYNCGLTGSNAYGTAGCPQLPRRFNFDTGYPFPQESASVPPGATFAAPTGSSLVFVNPDISNEMFHEFNLTAQWEFRPSWLAEAGYVGNRGRNLLIVRNIGTGNGPFPGSRQVGNHSTVQAIEYTGKSWYDALQTKLEKRYTKGLSLISTYVWSHAIDNSPGNFCIGGTGPTTCGFSNPLNPDLDKASSDFDVRHRFTLASVWDLPFGRGRRYWSDISSGLDALIGGWQLNNNVTIQSGPPFSIFNNGIRADVGNCATVPSNTFDGQTFCAARTPVFANDPGGPKFGTVGRNVFRGARQEFWDASLFKNIKVPAISEAFAVQLRIQAYNVLNHRNGFRPDNNLNCDSVRCTNATFGLDTFEQRRRQMEFGVRLLW
jgi:hypothetical protein